MISRKDELRALAERVEHGAGVDRELDMECRVASRSAIFPFDYNPKDFMTRIDDKWVPCTRASNGGNSSDRYCPRYTTSIDAAMTLVPEEGFIAALSEIAGDGIPGCCICTDTATTPPTQFWGFAFERGERQHVLARCVTAAALYALAEQEG